MPKRGKMRGFTFQRGAEFEAALDVEDAADGGELEHRLAGTALDEAAGPLRE